MYVIMNITGGEYELARAALGIVESTGIPR